MFRVACITKDGEIISQNFETMAAAQDWVLDIAIKQGIKTARIKDKMTGEITKVEI